MHRRHLSVIAVFVVTAVTAGACATSADTTSVEDIEVSSDQAAPTSTIVRTERGATETTTTEVVRASELANAGTDPTAVLTSLLGQFAATTPIRRNITLDDVGNAAAFLLSDLSGGISAEIVYVDGGFSHVAMSNPEG